MIKLLILAIVAGLVFESEQYGTFDFDLSAEAQFGEDEYSGLEFSGPYALPPVFDEDTQCWSPVHTKCWTPWFDSSDSCDEGGDRELVKDIVQRYPADMCPNPVDIEVMTLTGIPADKSGDYIRQMNKDGFICQNTDQPDNRKCQDYKVRFACYAPFCAKKVCYTDWMDRDNPSGTGDWEDMGNLRKNKDNYICDHPKAIQVQVVGTGQPACETGQKFLSISPEAGFVCRNEDQEDGYCLDYRVRFVCPCKVKLITW